MTLYGKIVEAKLDSMGGYTWAKATLAGLLTAFGGMMVALVRSDPTISAPVAAVLSGVVFSVGLFGVLSTRAELFNGDVMLLHAYSGTGSVVAWIWLWNLVGALFAAWLLRACGLGAEGALMAMAEARAGMSPVEALVRGIPCNMLVCLGVWSGFDAKGAADRLCAVLPPVTAFVALGFEHSVADMFYLGYGWMGGLTLPGGIPQLLMVTLGNAVGGVLFCELADERYVEKGSEDGED